METIFPGVSVAYVWVYFFFLPLGEEKASELSGWLQVPECLIVFFFLGF